MNRYAKKIVVDFDDTLCFSHNRDWENGQPNLELIKKLNNLYDCGWQVDIYTARGSISCSTREQAENKYRNSMEKWLEKYNVKYHNFSFQKPLAQYYIDDKAISPEKFLDLNIQELHGMSGAEIFTDGKLVHKTDSNSHSVRNWYENTIGVKVPKVYRVVGDTISIEYIENDKDFLMKEPIVAIDLIQKTLNSLQNNTITQNKNYSEYIDKIKSHCDSANNFFEILDHLKKIELKQSYSHGDFSINNMLFSDSGLYLIDPIPDTFGCLEIDLAKFIASLYINKYEEDFIYKIFTILSTINNIDTKILKVLICSEIIRVYRYSNEKEFIEGCFKNVFKSI